MSTELLNGFFLDQYQVLPREEKIIGPDNSHHVEPKVMQVLVALAANAGEVVTRDELLSEVWSDTIVGDEVLSRAISLLRGYLGDERTNPKYIRTLPRRGYELIIEPVPVQAAQAATRSVWQRAILIGVGAIVLSAAFVIWNTSESPPVSLAVLPLIVTESAADLATGGEGIADHLISALSRSADLRVVARSSSFGILPDTSMDIKAIGDLLDADYLVEGSLAQQDTTVTLTLSIAEAEFQTNVWTQQIVGSTEDLATLQADALDALSQAVQAHLGVSALTRGTDDSLNQNDEAYRKYLEARYQWSLRGELRISRAIDLLREAIVLEPAFARAHLALAHTVAIKAFYASGLNVSQESVLQQFDVARTSAETALQLDPELMVDVDVLEGFILMHQQQWLAAEQRLLSALQQNDDHVLAHYWYSHLLSYTGDFAEALKHIKKAVRMEPFSAVFNDRLALAYLWLNENEAAGRQYDVAGQLGYLESTQPKPYILYALRMGNYDDIRSLLERLGMTGAWVDSFVRGLEYPQERADSIQVLEIAIRNRDIPRIFWFGIWVLYQDADRAVQAFDPSFTTQDIELLWAAEAEFLRRDPRFAELLQLVNLDLPAAALDSVDE
jgi:DNA-binding winged helix-turn-helix (wHTH) protein/TolB-like protein